MVTVGDLMQDEKEAIAGYKEYLSQGVPRRHIQVIKKIIREEEKHIKMLRSLE